MKIPAAANTMKKERILFIVAHSDDHVIGAGGTILKYRKEGKPVTAIILSYGEKSHAWLKPQVAKQMRYKEALNAGSILDCTTIFYDLKESKFEKGFKNIKRDLTRLLIKEKPGKIFTHDSEDPHPDHKATFRIVQELLKETKLKTELYTFNVWNAITFKKREIPRLYVDISEHFKTKLKATFKFTSQKYNAIYPLLASIFVRAIKDGLHIQTRYAEKFYKIE